MGSDVPCSTARSLTVVACVSDHCVLKSNLLASPCPAEGSPYGVVLFKNCNSAAHGLNLGIERARGDWVLCRHEDVFLPKGQS
jgi:hypothetical protein